MFNLRFRVLRFLICWLALYNCRIMYSGIYWVFSSVFNKTVYLSWIFWRLKATERKQILLLK